MKYRVHHVRFFDHKPKAINAFACAEDSERLALSRSDGSIELWSIADDWYQEKIFYPCSSYSVEALLWFKDVLYSAGLEGELVEYDMKQLKPKVQIPGHSGAIWCLVKNASETHIAAGTEDGCVVLYKCTPEGFTYERALDKQEGRILSLSWHKKEEMIVTGGVDNIRVWSVTTGHAVQRITIGRQTSNLETIVWSVIVLDDMTIVSGDSRGKTCFWNGHQGTLLKAFTCHKADVLCVCASKSGDSVYSAGIDPAVVRFQLAPLREDSDWTAWVRSTVVVQHTHDVRALALCGQYLISGGIDTNLIFNNIEVAGREDSHGPKVWRRIPAVPQRQLVHLAKKASVVLFQYPDYVELCRLGSTNATSDVNGDVLSLNMGAVRLVQIRASSDAYIACSAVSSHASWVACSDKDRLRVYRVHLTDLDTACPTAAVTRVKFLPKEVAGAASCLEFVRDRPPGSPDQLVVATSIGTVHVLELVKDTMEATVVSTCTTAKGGSEEDPWACRLLAVSSDGFMAAAVSPTGEVTVLNIAKGKRLLDFTRKGSQPTALAFNSDGSLLAVAYTDQKIVEYDLKARGYSQWYRQHCEQFHPQWLRRHGKIVGISYGTTSANLSDKLIVHDEQMLCIIDKTQAFPRSEDKIFGKQRGFGERKSAARTEHAFHICNRYKHLLHFEELSADWAVVVECTPGTLESSLPAALRQKKFGT